jgi:hypothetical protein
VTIILPLKGEDPGIREGKEGRGFIHKVPSGGKPRRFNILCYSRVGVSERREWKAKVELKGIQHDSE